MSFAKQRRAANNPVSPDPANPPRFEPLPPFVGTSTSLTLSLETIMPGINTAVQNYGQIVFHALGDTGGIHGTETQDAIAEAMEGQITNAADSDKPKFFYHLGDVVYFNGQSENYVTQFYEPYQYYNAPIFAIPGNHDGDTHLRNPSDQPDNEPSLYGFMQNFCSSSQGQSFKHRSPMTQPYCYWKLEAPFVHVIGLYSNIDGQLDSSGTQQQQDWLIERLKATPQDKWLIIAVHHPCYSLDTAHGGYGDTLEKLDSAFNAAGRWPDVVLSGHVHNYQRFERQVGDTKIHYIVAGAGGYANNLRAMHRLPSGTTFPSSTTEAGVNLAYYEDQLPGFLRATANAKELVFDYFTVPFSLPATISGPVDTARVPYNGTLKTA